MTPPRDADELTGLTAGQLRTLLSAGQLSCEELTSACLARIAAREPVVEAWQFLDPDHALAQARALDADRRAGRPQGPLFGLPVGVKDIVDTADMPTGNGTPIMAGRRPLRDATVVARLRAAGAVILGKTVSTELALYTPGKTRNPHNPEHTPGGSSSGSAAAVADRMVPLAIGSQTNGSVIRPAAFCGVVGFKPSHGLISRAGVLTLSRLLDHVGVFARTLQDVALLADVLAGHDPMDPDTRAVATPQLLLTVEQPWPVTPALAIVQEPSWHLAEADMVDGMAELEATLGPAAAPVELPAAFADAHAAHLTVMATDMAHSFAGLLDNHRDRLSPRLLEILDQGTRSRAVDYLAARGLADRLRQSLEPLFERYDAILTPSAPGAAPAGLAATGNAAFCTIWTFLGLPAVSLPLLTAGNGLPMGVQLVGRPGDDARLLRTARWLSETVARSGNGA